MAGDPPRPGPRPRPDHNFPKPPVVRVLIVCDDEFSYSAAHKFGLTELIDALHAPSFFVNFAITKAHRENTSYAADADIKNFKFTTSSHFNPANFDEIWFFGLRHESETISKMNDQELRIVSEFMDNGGGVFATGDHEDLGASLCGRIPRVRSMRKWTFDYNAVADGYELYDPSSGDGPPVYGAHRHDTLIAGHNTGFTFDDQSDDLAAPIIPTIYGFGNQYLSYRYPHPVLCGPRGVIAILPDHMHEGHCLVPTNPGLSTTFDGYTSVEYPTLNSFQVLPDVIAKGVVTAHETDNAGVGGIQDVPAIAAQFGCIGAYDGQAASVGRVVVDSTFHHFVNINVNGTGSDSSDPIKQQGFYASSVGLQQFEQIQAYWRNIAIWLAPGPSADAMFYAALWVARWDSQIRMITAGLTQRPDNWRNMVAYGTAVHGVMKRFWSPCASLSWVFAQDNPLARFRWWLLLTLPDPPPWERLNIALPELVIGMLGHMMAGLVKAAPEPDAKFRDSLSERMPPIVKASYAAALRSAARDAEQKAAATKKFFDAVQR